MITQYEDEVVLLVTVSYNKSLNETKVIMKKELQIISIIKLL